MQYLGLFDPTSETQPRGSPLPSVAANIIKESTTAMRNRPHWGPPNWARTVERCLIGLKTSRQTTGISVIIPHHFTIFHFYPVKEFQWSLTRLLRWTVKNDETPSWVTIRTPYLVKSCSAGLISCVGEVRNKISAETSPVSLEFLTCVATAADIFTQYWLKK